MWLAHYGIPNMRWGVRNYQNYDGTLTPEGKRRYRKEISDIQKEHDDKVNAPLRNLGISGGESAEKYRRMRRNELKSKGLTKDSNETDILKKGAIVTRFTDTSHEPIDERRKYASFLNRDVSNYETASEEAALGSENDDDIFKEQYKLTKDVKIATAKLVEDELLSLYGDESAKKFVRDAAGWNFSQESRAFIDDFKDMPISNVVNFNREVSKIAEKHYMGDLPSLIANYENKPDHDKDVLKDLKYARLAQVTVSSWAHSHMMDDPKEIDSRLIKKGYDACVDYEDYAGGFARYPIIFLNPKESLKFYKEFSNYGTL